MAYYTSKITMLYLRQKHISAQEDNDLTTQTYRVHKRLLIPTQLQCSLPSSLDTISNAHPTNSSPDNLESVPDVL